MVLRVKVPDSAAYANQNRPCSSSLPLKEKYAKAALGCALLLIEGTVRKTGSESISITAERLFDLRRLGKR